MNVAVVGTGSISESIHIPVLQSLSNVRIIAICDSNEKQLSRVASKFNIEKKYTDFERMINENDIDVLDIATPGFTHFDMAKIAIHNDIHTLVEKPLTLNASQAEFLQNEALRRNICVGVCQTYRFREPVLKFQEIMRSGGIGTVERMVTMQRGSTPFALPSWFWDEKVSGGILFELGIHAIDLQCFLMGPHKKVLNVHKNFEPSLNFTTSINATIQYEHGIGIVDLKWLSSSNFFHQYISGTVADAIIKFLPDGFMLQQSDFAPLAELIGEWKRFWNFGYAVFRKRYTQKSQAPHRIVIENFVKSVEEKTEPLVTITNVLPTIRLIEEISSW